MDDMDQTLSELSRILHFPIPPFLKCPVCLDVLSDPRMLACTHTICSCCLDDLARFSHERPPNQRNGKVVRCPECRTVLIVTPDIEPPLNRGLAAAVNDWKGRISKERIEFFRSEVMSCNCHRQEEGLADLWCISCKHNICNCCRTQGEHKDHEVENIPDFEAFSTYRANVLSKCYEIHEHLGEVTSRVQRVLSQESAVADAHIKWVRRLDAHEERAHRIVSQKFKAVRESGNTKVRQAIDAIHAESAAGLHTLDVIGNCFDTVSQIMQAKDPVSDSQHLNLTSIIESYFQVTHERAHMDIEELTRSISAPLTTLCEMVDRFQTGNIVSGRRPLVGRRWNQLTVNQQGGTRGRRGRSRSRSRSPRAPQRQVTLSQNLQRILLQPSALATTVSVPNPPPQPLDLSIGVQSTDVSSSRMLGSLVQDTTATTTVSTWPTQSETERYWGQNSIALQNIQPEDNNSRHAPVSSQDNNTSDENNNDQTVEVMVRDVADDSDSRQISHTTESPLMTPRAAPGEVYMDAGIQIPGPVSILSATSSPSRSDTMQQTTSVPLEEAMLVHHDENVRVSERESAPSTGSSPVLSPEADIIRQAWVRAPAPRERPETVSILNWGLNFQPVTGTTTPANPPNQSQELLHGQNGSANNEPMDTSGGPSSNQNRNNNRRGRGGRTVSVANAVHTALHGHYPWAETARSQNETSYRPILPAQLRWTPQETRRHTPRQPPQLPAQPPRASRHSYVVVQLDHRTGMYSTRRVVRTLPPSAAEGASGGGEVRVGALTERPGAASGEDEQ